MTIIQLFYHIIHFFGIGNFYTAQYKIPNYIKLETTVITYTAFSFRKNIDKEIRNNIIREYGKIGSHIISYKILKIW